MRSVQRQFAKKKIILQLNFRWSSTTIIHNFMCADKMSSGKPPPLGAFLLNPLKTESECNVSDTEDRICPGEQSSFIIKDETPAGALHLTDSQRLKEDASGPTKASILMKEMFISGSADHQLYQSGCKTTVLPAKLLKEVKDFVKNQTVCLSDSEDMDNLSDITKPQMDDSGIGCDFLKSCKDKTMNVPVICSTDEDIETANFVEKCCKGNAVEDEMESQSVGHLDTHSPFNVIDTDTMESTDVPPVKLKDDVYNLSPLFTGELDKRRKRELKRSKKKGWHHSKKKRTLSQSDPDVECGETHSETTTKPSPNYFIAIQISNPKIHAALAKVQEAVILSNKDLSSAMNKLCTLHLTMMVLNLNTEEDFTRSRSALDKAMSKLMSTYSDSPLILDISGLGNFRNEIVFAKVKHEHQVAQLQAIAETVEDCFLEEGIVSTDKRGFKPHITVMKLSRAKGLRRKGVKKIDESFYKAYIDTHFGTQITHTLQLCAMLKRKDVSGYYQVEHSVQFGKNIEETADAVDNSMDLCEGNTLGKADTEVSDEVDMEVTCKVDTEVEQSDTLVMKSESPDEQKTDLENDDTTDTIKELMDEMIHEVEGVHTDISTSDSCGTTVREETK